MSQNNFITSLSRDTSGLLIPFAKNTPDDDYGDDHIVDVHSAERGRVWCLECNDPLIVRLCKEKRSHFSHYPSETTRLCRGESVLHRYAKELIYRYLVQKDKFFPIKTNCNKRKHNKVIGIRDIPYSVEIERAKVDDYKMVRPDISLTTPDNPFFLQIEVIVSHSPDPEAIAFYNRNSSPVLGVKIHSVEDIEKIINGQGIEGYWVGDFFLGGECHDCIKEEQEKKERERLRQIEEQKRLKREEEDRVLREQMREEMNRLRRIEEQKRKEKESESQRRWAGNIPRSTERRSGFI